MKFGFITLGANVPSTRFRFLPYLPYLKGQGHQCELWMSYPSVYEHIPWMGWRASHFLKRSVRCYQLMRASLWNPDCIYLERGCLNDGSLDLDRAFRKRTPRLVLDVDDGIFLEQPDKIDRLMEMSDHVVVSNEPIYEYVSQRHAHVTIVPTVVSVNRFVARSYAPDAANTARTVIGWIGTVPNMPFLEVCASALRALAKTYDYELLVIGPTEEPLKQLDLTGVRVNFKRWSASEEVQDLHRMDIGIMPLPDGKEWMRYKAATKLVQYLSCGIPAVASPIGVNATILENNQVGFAANDHDEWYQSLEKLLCDAQLRNKLGLAGRQLVTEKYSTEANASLLESVLKS